MELRCDNVVRLGLLFVVLVGVTDGESPRQSAGPQVGLAVEDTNFNYTISHP
jgi:hypothetical protein